MSLLSPTGRNTTVTTVTQVYTVACCYKVCVHYIFHVIGNLLIFLTAASCAHPTGGDVTNGVTCNMQGDVTA